MLTLTVTNIDLSAHTHTHIHTRIHTLTQSHEEDVSVSLFTDGLDAIASSSLTPATGTGGLSRSSSSSSAIANMWGGAGSSALSGLAYGAAMGVCDSDHKPVWCKLQLQLPAHVQQQKRRMSEQVRLITWCEGGAGQVGTRRRVDVSLPL
eukprot:1142841-Pelagomonas_calceolata.AAC.11